MFINLKKSSSKSGFSLVSLLIAMLIAGIMFLTIGVISEISISTNSKNKIRADIHNDVAYAFKMMRKYIHESYSYSKETPGSPWAGERLIINTTTDSSAFGLYQNANTNTVDFVYLPDSSDTMNRDVIFSLKSPANVIFIPTINAYGIRLRIYGATNNINFDMTSSVIKRRAT